MVPLLFSPLAENPMTQFAIVVVHTGVDTVTVGTHSFTDGFRVSVKIPHIRTEKDALAWALWLDNHGMPDEADSFLEHYCAQKNGNDSRTPPG